MSFKGLYRRNSVRLSVCLLIASALVAFLLPNAQAADQRGLAVFLLLDRSPSVRAIHQNESSIDNVASRLLSELKELEKKYPVPLYFGAANFGGIVSDPHPLTPFNLDVTPTLPRQEVISYTDFRVAFDYAQQQLDIVKRQYGISRAVVMLVTDSEPWPPGSKLTSEEKESYFQGTGRFSDPAEPSLPKIITNIRDRSGEVIVLAINDNPANEELWRPHLNPHNYLSTRKSRDISSDVKLLLEQQFQEAEKGATSTTTATTTIATPIIATHLPEDATPNTEVSAPRLIAWILLAALFLSVSAFSALYIRQRSKTSEQQKLIENQKKVIEDQRHSIDELKEERDEELNAVADLEKQAGAAEEQDKGRAIEIYKEILIKRADLQKRRDTVGSRGVSQTFSKMLDLCEGNLTKEQQLIRERLAAGQRKEVANGLAPVLLKRWKNNKEVLLSEFHLLRVEPLGIYVLDGLVNLANQGDGSDNEFDNAIGKLAQAARGLYHVTI